MKSVVERFIRYVKQNTRSCSESETIPTTPEQLDFAKNMVEELLELGLEDAAMDDKGFVTATLPSNIDRNVPVVGFLAHMDTYTGYCGENVKPQLHENYDGKDILLNKELGIVMSINDFPELKNYVGETLITTDGTTLLGADDKAGIAEIMTAIEYMLQHPEIPHGTIKIAFTPDEETGLNIINHLDTKKLGADVAYTLDGDSVGDISYENFNAAGARVHVKGRSIHPGKAKDKMINAIHIAYEFNSLLPEMDRPEHTDAYEGFFHLEDMSGDVENAELKYLIRDFDIDNYQNRKNLMKDAAKKINQKYGRELITVDIEDTYFNMKEKVKPVAYVIDNAVKAMEMAGISPVFKPIRGGTDGARLADMGLPTPNIFTGGHNYHGQYEFIPVFAMEKAVEVVINIIKTYAHEA